MFRFTVTFTTVTFLLAVFTAHAAPLSPADAVLVLDSPQAVAHAMAAPQASVTCAAGKTIGVWVDGRSSLDVQGFTIRDCAVGVVVQGIGHTVRGLTIHGSARAQAMPNVGMLLGGTDGQAYHNTIWGGEFGIVVIGLRHAVYENTVRDILRDGIMVTGQDNTIDRNVVDNSGRFGLNVGVMIPGATSRVGIPGFALPAMRNLLRGNVLTGNDKLDLRQWPTKCFDHEGYPETLNNTFEGNVFTTRSHACLQ